MPKRFHIIRNYVKHESKDQRPWREQLSNESDRKSPKPDGIYLPQELYETYSEIQMIALNTLTQLISNCTILSILTL